MESLYSSVFQSLPGLVCLLKSDLSVMDANPMFVQTLGIEFIGTQFDEFLVNQSDKAYFTHAMQHMTDVHYTFDDMAFSTVTGSISVKWSVSKVSGSDHLLMMGSVDTPATILSKPHQDSLDAVETHATPFPYSRQDLVHWFNRVPIGMHSVSGDGTIFWANRTLLMLLGYEPHEYIGQSLLKFIDNLPLLMAYGIRIREGKHIPPFPYSLIAKDGSTKKFMASIDGNFYPDGSFHYTRTFFRYDVNHLVNQAITNDRMQKQAVLAAEKDRFLRVMFHEIRTPLHNLSNSFHSVIRQSKLAAAVIDEMSYQIDACTGLVEDLSFSTMFESDQVLHPRPVKMNLRKELESILQHVSLFQEMEMSTKIITLTKDIDFAIPEIIQVDQALMKALGNLIKNAVKYCNHKGTVTLHMTYTDKPRSSGSGGGEVMTSPGTGAQLKSGTLSVSIKNSVSEAMDLVMVNKMFQSPYSSHSSFAGNNPLTMMTHTPPTSPVGADATATAAAAAAAAAAASAVVGAGVLSSAVSPTAPGGAIVERPHSSSFAASSERGSSSLLSWSEKGSDSPHSSISDSLMSSEGLGLGLYVAYNIISNLGGLLECSGSESESVFSFSVPVQSVASQQRLLTPRYSGSPLPKPGNVTSSSSGGGNAASGAGAGGLKMLTAMGIAGGGPLLSLRANKKSWFHAIDSAEGSKHVDCSTLRSDLSVAVEHVRGHKPRILVVDDSPICRKVLVKALESNGYDTDTACDGKEACDKLDRPPCLFDAVLMDLRMPIMDGITATRVCKSKSHLCELPIIIVTAELGEEVRRECMEAKASHFISKPAKMEDLLLLLEEYLHHKES